MKKLALDAAELRVESFTAAPAGVARGTVAGNALTVKFNCPETNFQSCPNPTHCAIGC